MILFLPLAAAIAFSVLPVCAETGVPVSAGESAFYGGIDIGIAPPPVLAYREPVYPWEHAP